MFATQSQQAGYALDDFIIKLTKDAKDALEKEKKQPEHGLRDLMDLDTPVFRENSTKTVDDYVKLHKTIQHEPRIEIESIHVRFGDLTKLLSTIKYWDSTPQECKESIDNFSQFVHVLFLEIDKLKNPQQRNPSHTEKKSFNEYQPILDKLKNTIIEFKKDLAASYVDSSHQFFFMKFFQEEKFNNSEWKNKMAAITTKYQNPPFDLMKFLHALREAYVDYPADVRSEVKKQLNELSSASNQYWLDVEECTLDEIAKTNINGLFKFFSQVIKDIHLKDDKLLETHITQCKAKQV